MTQKEIRRRHYLKHRAKILEKQRADRALDPEKYRAATKKWRAKNIEKARENGRLRQVEYYRQHADAEREKARARRAANPDKMREQERKRDPRRTMLYGAKKRARDNGLPFDLTIDDIHIPEHCPVLPWIRLERGNGRIVPSSPSLERLVPERGYVRGNVHVISYRANNLRSDGTAKDIEHVLEYVRKIENGEYDLGKS